MMTVGKRRNIENIKRRKRGKIPVRVVQNLNRNQVMMRRRGKGNGIRRNKRKRRNQNINDLYYKFMLKHRLILSLVL